MKGLDYTIAAKGRKATPPTAYDVLGCPPGADAKQLRDSYYALVRREHPDAGGEGFVRLGLAYNELKTPERRAAYDRRLRLEGRLDCAACGGRGLVDRFERGRYLRGIGCRACGGRGYL